MIKEIIKLTDKSFVLGYTGENAGRVFLFDITKWLQNNVDGTPSITVKRPNDDVPYLAVNVSLESNYVIWKVDNRDTEQAGEGIVQLSLTSGNGMIKSKIYSVEIKDSVVNAPNPPIPTPPWFDSIIVAGAKAEEAMKHSPAIRGNEWYLWDSETSSYIATGVMATIPGPQGPEGKQGKQGEKGERGDKGEIGLTGPTGKTGPMGPQGPQGNVGPQGLQGEKGEKGEPGRDGINGKDGVDGKDGKDGLPGKDGVNGKDGLPGPKGDKGEPSVFILREW